MKNYVVSFKICVSALVKLYAGI